MTTWDWSVRLACALVVLLDESEWLERLRFRVPAREAPTPPPSECPQWGDGVTKWGDGTLWGCVEPTCQQWGGGAKWGDGETWC